MNIDRDAEIRAAKSAWAASPALRAEFGDDERSFIAYRCALAEGRIKVIRQEVDGRPKPARGTSGTPR